MTIETAGIKSLCLPLFDGKHEKFQVWWTHLEAYAGVFGFLAALQPGGKANMLASKTTVIDKTTDPGKLQVVAKKPNAIAVVNMTMAFITGGTMALVYKSKMSDWPSGLAHLISTALKNKYQPHDMMTRVEMRHQLNKFKMKKGADPAMVLFEQLSSIRNKYNMATRMIDQEDLITVVINAAPQEYQSVLTDVQLRLQNSVTLDDLNRVKNSLWKTHAANNGDKSKEDDMVLYSISDTRRKATRLMNP
jgi:hypothetical protein